MLPPLPDGGQGSVSVVVAPNEWRPDPSHRFEERFVLNGEWSALVRTAGVEQIDAPVGIRGRPDEPEPPPPLPEAAAPAPVASDGAVPPPPAPMAGAPLPPPMAPGPDGFAALLPPPSPLPTMATLSPPSERSATPKRWLVRGGAAVAVLAVAVGGLVVVSRTRSHASPWASSWDPRVDDLRMFVEQDRSLLFEHPVKVIFQSDSEFEAGLKEDDSEANTPPKDVQDRDASLRAIGAINGTLDVAKTSGDLATNVVGYYSFDDKVVRVRGNDLTPYVRLTLVHELTHAAQDQNYDLNKLYEKAAESGSDSALRAVVEADAMHVEDDYRAKLTDTEEQQAKVIESGVSDNSTGDEAPPLFQLEQAMPYTLGPAFIQYVLDAMPDSSMADLFERPPSSDADLLNPARYVSKMKPAAVDKPALSSDEHGLPNLGIDRIGAFDWYAMLSGRVDPVRALRAVSGWNGDRAVAFEKDSKVCVRADVALDAEDAAADFGGALSEWGKQPAGAVEVKVDGTHVMTTMCDPGVNSPDAVADKGDVEWRSSLPLVQVQLQSLFRSKDFPEARSRCTTSAALRALPRDVLMSDDVDAARARVTQAVQAAVAQCGG